MKSYGVGVECTYSVEPIVINLPIPTHHGSICIGVVFRLVIGIGISNGQKLQTCTVISIGKTQITLYQ